MNDKKLVCLSCGVFSKEVRTLADRGVLPCNILSLDSMLHMNPSGLEQAVDQTIASGPENAYVLLYGDCCPHMHELQNKANVSKVSGINCCEILVGKEAYRKLQKENAFIFLPEWTFRWREIFTSRLGFKKQGMAQAFMQEHCSRLVYIDTGILPVPEKTIREISGSFDMPIEVLPVSLDFLLQGINEALQKFKGGRLP